MRKVKTKNGMVAPRWQSRFELNFLTSSHSGVCIVNQYQTEY